MPGETWFQIVTKIVTVTHQLARVAEDIAELRKTVTELLDRHEQQLTDIRERLARLEGQRDGDLAEMKALIAQFSLEMERAEVRLQKAAAAIPADASRRLEPGQEDPNGSSS